MILRDRGRRRIEATRAAADAALTGRWEELGLGPAGAELTRRAGTPVEATPVRADRHGVTWSLRCGNETAVLRVDTAGGGVSIDAPCLQQRVELPDDERAEVVGAAHRILGELLSDDDAFPARFAPGLRRRYRADDFHRSHARLVQRHGRPVAWEVASTETTVQLATVTYAVAFERRAGVRVRLVLDRFRPDVVEGVWVSLR